MDVRTPEQVDAWLKALEAERHDTTYLGRIKVNPEIEQLRAENAKLRAELAATPKPLTPSQRKRDSVMFHAGRHAAGIRDDDAIAGFERMQTMIKRGK